MIYRNQRKQSGGVLNIIDEEDFSLYDGQIRVEDGYLVRRWTDEGGQSREIFMKIPSRICQPTGIEFDWNEESTAYHREYYGKIRRHCDGRMSRILNRE